MPDTQQTLSVSTSGCLSFVWDDSLQPLLALGEAQIRRVSHVEPTAGDGEAVQWTADLSPVGGPVLGPYRLRGEALAAEREWLDRHG